MQFTGFDILFYSNVVEVTVFIHKFVVMKLEDIHKCAPRFDLSDD